jgi:DNA topoisomerase-1
MPKNLVIVESPAKAKTIEGYLGSDYVVKSSFGHVRDLPEKDLAVDIQNNYKPLYEVSEDKKEVISQLKKWVKETELVWLATDDDREGEAISWHLKEALNLKEQNIRRIVFREITKNAILNAIQSPRSIDTDLVNAQQARRVLDRLVGYELSPVLWKKVKMGLSAGRVQSVAVRLIVEREREIEAFQPKSSYKVSALFEVSKGKRLVAELIKNLDTESDARAFLERCIGALFSIHHIETKPAKKSPAPPFTTSTLQQEASRKLSFSVSQTMLLAQKLYEAGKITYMRTDSTNLSQEAIQNAKAAIEQHYGKQYVQTRQYKTKSESAQEAHEAIRPTDFTVSQAGSDRNEQRLYELIWKRAIASQMADAQLERTTVNIGIRPGKKLEDKWLSPSGELKEQLIATGEVIKFDGFLKVYLESTDEEDEESKGMLPLLTLGQELKLEKMTANQRFTRPSARYTEASLVKRLEELGIGRPSTYAPTLSTILKRGYVVKEDREGKPRAFKELLLQQEVISEKMGSETVGSEKAKLFPTDVANVVNDFLVQHFPDVIDYSFTANVEKEFDEIASGKREWVEMIDAFYQEFHRKIEGSNEIKRSEVGTSRQLGIHPVNGKKISVRLGRFGPFAQIGDVEDEEKPQFASLRKGQRMETLSLEEALELFKLPREIGHFEDKPMKVAIGRFGPYIQHDSKYYSLGQEDDPYTIEEERGLALIKAKRKADAEKFIKEFPENPEVKVLNGRYGPYIQVGRQNVKIPKDKQPQSLTLEECLALAETAPQKTGRTNKKAPAKTAQASKKTASKTSTKKTSSPKTSKGLAPKKNSTASAKTNPKKKLVKKTAEQDSSPTNHTT